MALSHGGLILLFLIGGALCLDLPVNMCSNPGEQKESLSPKMKLVSDYTISGTRTDWIKNVTQYFGETLFKGQRAISVSGRTESSNFVTFASGSIYSINSSSCVKQTENHALGVPPQILAALSLNDSSISSFVNGIVDFSVKNNGSYNDSTIVAGVEGVTWISCVNTTEFGFQVEVIFSGDMSIPPASGAYNNPQMLFVRLSQFPLTANASFSNSVSYSIDRRTEAAERDAERFEVPKGVICDGWAATPLSLNISDPVNIVVDQITENGPSFTYEAFYSRGGNLAVVNTVGLKQGDIVPFFGTPAKEASSFVHDFFTGYEFALSDGKCSAMDEIQKNSAEVLIEGEKFGMKALEDVFVNKSLAWQDYGKKSGEIGNVFRALDAAGNVVEVVSGTKKFITRTYTKGALVSSTSVQIFSTVAPRVASVVSDCFAMKPATNGSYMFVIKNKKLADVATAGEEVLTAALAEALTKVAPVSQYRIKAFFTENPDGNLGVFVRVAEKNDKAPSPTASSYDYKGEVSTAALFEKLNETVSKQDWKFTVTVLGKPEEFSVAAASLAHYPPPPPAGKESYQGYTGGSMFVLGLFSLIFGCAIGAGSLFFITKRQRISTLAYQVFE